MKKGVDTFNNLFVHLSHLGRFSVGTRWTVDSGGPVAPGSRRFFAKHMDNVGYIEHIGYMKIDDFQRGVSPFWNDPCSGFGIISVWDYLGGAFRL